MDSTEKAPKKEAPAKADAPAKAKRAAKVKQPKEVKVKKEKAPKETQVVFAFRLTEAQRDAIHKAAGPGKASRFVLDAALALAKGDGEALQKLAAETHSRLK